MNAGKLVKRISALEKIPPGPLEKTSAMNQRMAYNAGLHDACEAVGDQLLEDFREAIEQENTRHMKKMKQIDRHFLIANCLIVFVFVLGVFAPYFVR